jgi:hypothetical protein
MPHFAVLATELVTQYVVFHVEAENEDEAREKVIDGEYDCSYEGEQHYVGPMDIYSVEEM